MSSGDYRDVTVSSKVCLTCGALVADRALHASWHAGNDDAGYVDGWEAAVGTDPSFGVGWSHHMRIAVERVSNAMYFLGRQDGEEHYIGSIEWAAKQVRAMAPQGTKWEDPWDVGKSGPKAILRAAIRSLVSADEFNDAEWADMVPSLQRTDSYLHGLWLAAKEKP